MTLHSLPTESLPPATELSTDFDAMLGSMTAALARGELAQGTQIMEQALTLNVRWEQLTSAVHAGIERGYEQPSADAGAR